MSGVPYVDSAESRGGGAYVSRQKEWPWLALVGVKDRVADDSAYHPGGEAFSFYDSVARRQNALSATSN